VLPQEEVMPGPHACTSASYSSKPQVRSWPVLATSARSLQQRQ
jgi:hypothetical protein